MPNLSEAKKQQFQAELAKKMTDLLAARNDLPVYSVTDEAGTRFIIEVPKGADTLRQHVGDIAALISQRQA
jgi:hypothetical protein